jgi:hypothetical protein
MKDDEAGQNEEEVDAKIAVSQQRQGHAAEVVSGQSRMVKHHREGSDSATRLKAFDRLLHRTAVAPRAASNNEG